MNNIYLISEQYIKSKSLIDTNVDASILLPAIDYSQDIKLTELIGLELVEKIKHLVENNTIKDSTNIKYKVLLEEFIIPYLSAQVVSEIQIPLNYKIRNAGIVGNLDDKNSIVNLDDIKYLKSYYEDKAQFYGQRMIDYICNNNYAEYFSKNKPFGEKSAFKCNLYL